MLFPKILLYAFVSQAQRSAMAFDIWISARSMYEDRIVEAIYIYIGLVIHHILMQDYVVC
jgi:hypothetical protein